MYCLCDMHAMQISTWKHSFYYFWWISTKFFLDTSNRQIWVQKVAEWAKRCSLLALYLLHLTFDDSQ